MIHTEIELTSALQNIEADKTTTIPGKEKMKLELLKNHIRIRNKISSSSRISLNIQLLHPRSRRRTILRAVSLQAPGVREKFRHLQRGNFTQNSNFKFTESFILYTR